jgi:mannose-1-phosphate guanylyltransferase/mannose-6-phosphate isomerase
VHLMHWDAGATMAVLPADHHVADPEAFCRGLEVAQSLALDGSIVTLGISPTSPETGYGYIEQGEQDGRSDAAWTIARFAEKPDLQTAQRFLDQGNFLWNAGIFVMQPAIFLAEVARQLPELHDAMMEVAAAIGRPSYGAVLERVYARIKGISIDYGVMERARNACVVPVSCGWSDVGSWSALGAVVPADAHNNVVRGRAIVRDSTDCIVSAEAGHVVALVGVKDLVVVHTADATLVVPRERAQEVKNVLDDVTAAGWREYL